MPKGKYRLMTCDGCGKEIAANVFNRHVTRSCGKVIEKKKRVAWNKGLSCSTDERVANLGRSISVALTGKPGRPLSEKQKKNLSALQSQRLKDGYADGSRGQYGGYCKWFEVDGVKVQGTWELRAAKILSLWKRDNKIKNWSRCPHRVPYVLDDKQHTYSPDFLVERTDGTKYILEIKGRQSILDDIKWKAAAASFEFVVWRLQDIQDNERE